jgi:hypothetical protein
VGTPPRSSRLDLFRLEIKIGRAVHLPVGTPPRSSRLDLFRLESKDNMPAAEANTALA